MYNYNETQISPYHPTKLEIHSILRPEDDLKKNCGQDFTRTVSFDDIVHFIDEESIVTYVDFDCGFTFYPATSTKKRDRSTENGITFPDPVKNLSAIPTTINITVPLMSSKSLLYF